MLSKQHLAVALNAIADAHPDYSVKQIEEEFQRMAPYVVVPDTIRGYGVPREMTHYEDGDVNKDTFKIDHSSFSYPADLKSLSKESVQELVSSGHVGEKFGKAVIGGDTNIDQLKKSNPELKETNPELYYGILAHLKQDVIFDRLIRTEFDCSEKYEDRFYKLNEQAPLEAALGGKAKRGAMFDGKEFRSLIADIEERGFIYMAGRVHDRTGIMPDQEWFDRNVKPALDKAYTPEMAESAYKYMGFPDKTKEMLAAKDFSVSVTKAEANAYEHAIKQTALEFSPLSAPAGLDR